MKKIEQDIWNTEGESITIEDMENLTDSISENELWEVINNSPLNKSPGSDGLTTEFYKEYWLIIKHYLIKSLNHSLDRGKLNISQRRGIITLIPKPQKDLELLKNWRPITLLNQDYKYLTKILAIRLEKTMKTIISNDQSGFVKGRYIGCNIQRLQNMIESCSEEKTKGWIINIDFEKAFDTIEWPFIYKTLEVMGYPEKFIAWIKTLYNDIETCVINNGHTTEFFKPERGVRQGCPISPYLFILTTEIMNRWLKKHLNQYGIIDKNGQNYLISQFADDTSFSLREDNEGIHSLFNLLKNYGEISGLKLNINKTEIMVLNHTENNKMPTRYRRYIKREVQYLGCQISVDYKETTKKNIDKATDKMNNMIDKWMNRRTTLSGKIAIIKSLLIPQVTYALTTMASPDIETVKNINKKLFKFINSGGGEKIKRNILIGEYEEGGFKMTDLESYIRAIKINWMTRLLNIDGIWKEYILEKIGMNIEYFSKCNVIYKDLHFRFPKNSMWDEVMREWCSENFTNPETYQEILNQNLWRNSHIKIGNKTQFWKKWYDNDIKWVADLILIENNGNSRFLTLQELNDLSDTSLKQMEYNSLLSALPKKWKQMIKSEDNYTLEEDRNEPLIISLIDAKKPMRKIYMKLKNKKAETPENAMNKWREKISTNMTNKEMLKAHTNNHYITINAAIRSFNCNFFNRNVPYNSRLVKMEKLPDKNCMQCKVEETLEHLYWDCPNRKRIWEKIKEIYEYYNGSPLLIDKKKCLLGIHDIDNEEKKHLIEQQRWLFLIGKHYLHINKCREDAIPSENGIVRYIKRFLKIELLSSEKKGTQNLFRGRWDGWMEWIEEG
jgi:hypothetical protein